MMDLDVAAKKRQLAGGALAHSGGSIDSLDTTRHNEPAFSEKRLARASRVEVRATGGKR